MEVFLQADVAVVQSWSSRVTELRRASTETCRIAVVAGIKPKNAAALSCAGIPPAEDGVGTVAVRAQSPRGGASQVFAASIKAHRETGMQGNDRTNCPTANHGINGFVHHPSVGLGAGDGATTGRVNCRDQGWCIAIRKEWAR